MHFKMLNGKFADKVILRHPWLYAPQNAFTDSLTRSQSSIFPNKES